MTTPNDGKKVLACMPAATLNTIYNIDGKLDLSSPSYVYNLYMGMTPGTGGLYYKNA